MRRHRRQRAHQHVVPLPRHDGGDAQQLHGSPVRAAGLGRRIGAGSITVIDERATP